jgi:hypothetical protein
MPKEHYGNRPCEILDYSGNVHHNCSLLGYQNNTYIIWFPGVLSSSERFVSGWYADIYPCVYYSLPTLVEPSSVTKHSHLHEKPPHTPSFIICQFGFFFFTVYRCWGQRSKKMPAFVTSDNRKDLVSLLDTGLTGGGG